jgi:serine/threonine protein kinase
MAAATSSSGVSRFYSDFDVIAELGNGSFGNVFKVLSKVDGCMYAIKVAHRPAKGNADRDRMLKEVYALAALGNQSDTATFHIVRYHQAWMEDHRLYIQTELCTTTLQAELKLASPAALPIERQYKCLREILLALEFIHKNGMCHLDIKPEK